MISPWPTPLSGRASPIRLRLLSLVAFLAAALLLLWASLVSLCAQRGENWATRDTWQRPDEVMDALGIRAGSVVADVGCGEGYFVMRLARRVGAEGLVYAADVDEKSLQVLRRRLESEKLSNVRVIHSAEDDPRLPAGALDAVLIVNAYHEMKRYDPMLAAIYAALKPGGRLATIEPVGEDDADRSKHFDDHTISEKLVQQDAARHGFRFRGKLPGFERPEHNRRHWFFLLFDKPAEI